MTQEPDSVVILSVRGHQATRSEATALNESIIADLRRDQLISETIGATVNQTQSAGSGGMLGLGISLGGGSAWSDAHRDLHLSTVHTLSDRIQQSSSSLRDLRTTVVVAAHQQECNVLTTRNITNYNHSHTLTILYFEMLRHLRVVTELDRGFQALVRFPQLPYFAPTKAETLIPYASFLNGRLLDPSLEALGALDRYALELQRTDPQAQPTAEQQTKIFGITMTIGLAANRAIDANHSAIGFGVSSNGLVVHLVGTSQIRVAKGPHADPALYIEAQQFFPYSNLTSNDLGPKERSFSLQFSQPQTWDDLSGMYIQLVFPDNGNDRQYVLRIGEVRAATTSGTVDLRNGTNTLYFQNTTSEKNEVNCGDDFNNDQRLVPAYWYPFRRPAQPGTDRAPFQPWVFTVR